MPVPAETDHPGRRVNTGGGLIGASPVWAAPIKEVGGMAQPLNMIEPEVWQLLSWQFLVC